MVVFWLSYPDSNQEMRHQKPLCYHYTIGQSHVNLWHVPHNCAAKVLLFSEMTNKLAKKMRNILF